MIVCHVCGTENPDGAKFCEGCGVELQAAPSASSVPMTSSPEAMASTPSMPPVEATPAFTSDAPVETPPLEVEEEPLALPASDAVIESAPPVVAPVATTPTPTPEPDIKATMPDAPVTTPDAGVTTPTPIPAASTTPKVARLVPRAATSETYELNSPQMVVGRFDPSAGPVDIDLASDPGEKYISRRHAELYQENGVWFVRDLGSTNGVYVKKSGQGQYSPRLTEPAALGDGDEVAFGNVKFVFQQSTEA